MSAVAGSETKYVGEIPYITTAQMVEVDRVMIEDYGIELIQMMENAGRCLARLAQERYLGSEQVGQRVAVLAGSGGNGGGAMVAARRLHNWGSRVEVALSKPAESLGGVPRHQLEILLKMGVPVVDRPGEAVLIVDGLIGYSLRGDPRGRTADLIRWANEQPVPKLALDVPSGMDSTSGRVFDPAIEADATMTLALPKQGLEHADVGELFLADISVPPAVYRSMGLEVGRLFVENDILRVR